MQEMGNSFKFKIMEGINRFKEKLKMWISMVSAQASLEFVLIIPLIILIVIAVSHLGLLIYEKNILEQAAREGARVVTTTNSNSEAVSCIREICSSLEGGRLDIRIIPESSSGRKVGDIVKVTVSYNYGDSGSLIKIFTGKNKLIESKSYMRMECY
jgi:hypothetical protein